MTSFSLIKVGNAYVVRAHDQCVLKIASRRKAEQLINQAAVLLDAASDPAQTQSAAESTTDGEASEVS